MAGNNIDPKTKEVRYRDKLWAYIARLGDISFESGGNPLSGIMSEAFLEQVYRHGKGKDSDIKEEKT